MRRGRNGGKEERAAPAHEAYSIAHACACARPDAHARPASDEGAGAGAEAQARRLARLFRCRRGHANYAGANPARALARAESLQ